MGGQGALRYGAMLPGYFGSVVGFSAAVPDMQSPMAQLGINVLNSPTIGPGVTYEAVFGSPDGAYAAGNSPQELAANYAHTRIYLTSGDGVNCPGDPKTSTFVVDQVTETVINQQQAPFADATRAAGADVTTETTCGVHTFGVWDRAIPAAKAWGFFRPVAKRPRAWTYRTIATSGNMWGLGFRFRKPPQAVVNFERRGKTLLAKGKGRVLVRIGERCRLSLKLPFRRKLPPRCLRLI